jgi:hypothetical protein
MARSKSILVLAVALGFLAALAGYAGLKATAAQVAQILANPAGHYFNVHTTLNGGGAIRGQLQ